MSSIANAMSVMGYARVATFVEGCCRTCGHGDARATGLRCTKGGFYVSPAGSCKHFAQPAPASGQPLQIGPTDV